jgi:hypothetical protein
MKHVAALFLLSALTACAARAPADQPRVVPIPAAVPTRPSFATSDIARRAWDLYQQVIAHQIALKALPPGALDDIADLIVHPSSTGYLVRYTNEEAAAIYDVHVGSGAPVARTNEPPLPLSGPDLRRWRAQAAWRQRLQDVEVCSSSHQIAAIPADDGRGWLSYLIPMPDSPGFMQLGGFYVLHLDETGEKVIEQRALRGKCGGWRLTTDTRALTIAQRGLPPPTESDVYSSLLWEIAIFISIAEPYTVWAVDDAGVSDVTDKFPREER